MAQDYGTLTTPDRTAVINAALNSIESSSAQTDHPSSPQALPPSAPPVSPPSSWDNNFKISGDARTSMGIYSNGTAVFTRANADLNEKNWRVLSSAGLNDNINTYDPALYSRLKVVMDASVAAAVVSVHLNISVDPWSYTGKSNTQLVTSEWGDTAKIQYLFWGNTGYTVNSIVNTLGYGGSVALPEVKTKGNRVPAISVPSSIQDPWGDTDIFNIPAAKINYTFQPVREAWVDLKPTDEIKLRIFPMGFEDQALSTDDPLKLSNNKEWYAESPWIDGWQGGNLNTGVPPVTFTKGQWDKSLSFFTKDSDGQRLTSLRGVSLEAPPTDETSLKATIAAPKTLWQDYGDITALPASARLKQFIGDLFYIGTVADVHQGYVNGQKDAENYTGGVDTGFMPMKWLKASAEYATSRSRYDETTPDYATKYSGKAYYVSLEAASNPEGMLKKDYYNFNPIEKTDIFFKSRVYFARMDQGFESSLSDYNSTRQDSFWGEHLSFYPSEYRYLPGISPGMSQYDLEPFSIGNGIDYGRSVVAWRGDTNLLEGKLHGLADARHVADNNDDNIENVLRTAWTLEPTDQLTTKLLLLWHDLPKTTAGVDPFLIEDNTAAERFANTSVEGGKDPSLTTESLGARYALSPWAALNGVWEFTNDVTLATNDFPQGDLNSTYFSTYTQNGKIYTTEVPQLYDQSYFEQAPYLYHNIFKTGLELTPTQAWHVYLDYTRNPNKFAGNIDDNMSHYGIETSYVPTSKIGFFARYTFSEGYDTNRLVNDKEMDYRDYNNFFFETRMILPKDVTMSIQYGVGSAYNIITSNTNPSLTFYATTVVETQHVVRIVFDKKF
ncbi:MAG: hypothetical protein HQL12_03320 [Candidatus Omnitrophica bacterium]|nr:hypothetical protein [Candidatus Omnitrophota bacterium]